MRPGDHAARRKQIPFAGEKPHLKPSPLAPYRALLTSAHRRILAPSRRHPNDGALIVILRAGDYGRRKGALAEPGPGRERGRACLVDHLQRAN